jgi:hypothetical protein
MLFIGAVAALALGGPAWAGKRVVGSSPYRTLEPQSGDLQKLPQKPNRAIQEGRAAAVAHAPGIKPKMATPQTTEHLERSQGRSKQDP